jgi:hypothetical protein
VQQVVPGAPAEINPDGARAERQRLDQFAPAWQQPLPERIIVPRLSAVEGFKALLMGAAASRRTQELGDGADVAPRIRVQHAMSAR